LLRQKLMRQVVAHQQEVLVCHCSPHLSVGRRSPHWTGPVPEGTRGGTASAAVNR
jgi:hypothetical protein